MEPNFALTLSFDGIALLHRGAGGIWDEVGAVPLDTEDLAGELAALRVAALARDPAGLATMLVIPDEQIRYLDLPAASAPHGDHDAAAAEALDGATPYALDELAYDWTVAGARLHVAAVARETLEEAESFALEHGFNPVSFTAWPEPASYPGAPNFGPTQSAESPGTALPESGPGTEPEAEPEAAPPLFASIRAERGLPPVPAPKLDGAARFTPAPPIAETEVRALSGAARDSLAPRPPQPEQTVPEPRPHRAASAPVAGPAIPAPEDEAERLTIFGARRAQQGPRGRPRLGLILTAALVVLMIGIAALAAIFPESGVGRLLRGAEPQIAVTPEIPELAALAPKPPAPEAAPARPATVPAPEAPRTAPPPDKAAQPKAEAAPRTASAPPPSAPPPSAAPPSAAPQWAAPRTPEEARARYAATGIWPVAPGAPAEPPGGTLDTFYQTSIDGELNRGDAIALPAARDLAADARPPLPAPPPRPGQTFVLDARGLVAARPEGALTPAGVIVRAGPPPVRPPDMPVRAVPIPDLTPTPEARAAREGLSGIRPRPRPENLSEQQERGALGGLSRGELAALRPRARPASLIAAPEPDAAAIEAALGEATEQAVAASLKPRLRPQSLVRAVPRQQPQADSASDDGEPELTRTAAAAPRIPTSASIAQQATTRNAINLRQVNLIGVYGTPSDRRALVRLPNGRYQKVQVGDRIDGGRVSAIGDDELRYRKGSRDVVLRLPKG
ncbi:MAG: hypothetical protein CMN17_03890 [Roseovarius sp.]|nr:hypothetical protein [Roseovarius sp.]